MEKRLTRSEFLAGGATVCLSLAAGGALVAGCTRMSALDADQTRPPGAPKNFLARERDVNPAFYFAKGKVKGVLVRSAKGIAGYENQCSHMGSPCSLREGALVCVWHGAAFDPETGKPLRGPAKEPLRPLKLELKDGLVLLAGL